MKRRFPIVRRFARGGVTVTLRHAGGSVLKHPLWPDWYFEDITFIPPGFFKKNKIKYLICDIDNTLVTYADPTPTPTVHAFFALLEREGVKLAFASNNSKKRVKTFADGTGYPAIYGAGKPFGRGVRKAMNAMGAELDSCAMMGDQLLTDGLAALHRGMRMILVNPIKTDDKKNTIFRVKRRMERPIMRGYLKRHRINDPVPWKNLKKYEKE